MSHPDTDQLTNFDNEIKNELGGVIAGIDEAGRGPLAGPVVAGAVILFKHNKLEGINDSKKLPAKRREFLFQAICAAGLVGIGIADEKTIDEINIYQATRLAMKRAVLALTRTPDCLLIDGNMTLDLPLKQRAIVKGDQKSASIAAASIIAKVYRDSWMERLDNDYPQYEFARHKGYPTPIHLNLLKSQGPSPVHRYSFAPVREAALARNGEQN